MITLIIGPSAVGKTTIVNRINECPEHSSLLGKPINTITTRPPRDEDEHYEYVSIDEFKRLIEEDRLAEWANVHDNFYGTHSKYFSDTSDNYYKVIDYQGALQLMQEYGEQLFTTIFIYPKSLEELRYRLNLRSDGNEEKRFSNALKEMSHANLFNYIIINDDLDESISKVKIILSRSIITDR